MFRSYRILALALGLCVTCQVITLPTLCAQPVSGRQPPTASISDHGVKIPPEVKKLLVEGDQLHRSGKPLDAAKKFQEARDVATKVRDPKINLPQVQSAALLREANVYYSEAIKGNDRRKFSEALNLFENIDVDAAPAQKTQAAVYRASLQMKLGKYQEAAGLLLDTKQCDWSTVDESQHFVLNYNVGRALDEGKQPIQAMGYYNKALQLKPQFNLAAGRICDLAIADRSLDSELLDKQVQLLISTKHPEEVSRLGWGLFQRDVSGDPARSIKGLAILLTGWSMTFENGDSFLKSEGERLALLEDSSVGRRLGRDIKRLVQGELAVEAGALETGKHSQLPGVSQIIELAGDEQDDLRVAVSSFTFAIADRLATRSSLTTDPAAARASTQAALARNIVAFALDSHNTDAARSLVWCLTRVEELNPEEIDEDLRNQVIDSLLREKEGIRGKPNKEISDWQNLLKIHTLLAELFQSRKIWVAETRGRSATFFWEEARNDEIEVQNRLPENLQQWNPALHENLAICYAESDRIEEAVKYWLTASDYYLRNDDLAGATRCLNKVRSSGSDLTVEKRQRVAILEERIQDLDTRIKNAPK